MNTVLNTGFAAFPDPERRGGGGEWTGGGRTMWVSELVIESSNRSFIFTSMRACTAAARAGDRSSNDHLSRDDNDHQRHQKIMPKKEGNTVPVRAALSSSEKHAEYIYRLRTKTLYFTIANEWDSLTLRYWSCQSTSQSTAVANNILPYSTRPSRDNSISHIISRLDT